MTSTLANGSTETTFVACVAPGQGSRMVRIERREKGGRRRLVGPPVGRKEMDTEDVPY